MLVAALVVLSGALLPGWRFQHMTAAEHLRAARRALDEQSLETAQRHLNASPAGTPGAARLMRKLEAEIQAHGEILQQEADAQLAELAQAEAQRAAVRQLEQNLRNMGFDVTVAQSPDPSEITIAARGFDDPDRRDWFLALLHGPNNPVAPACAAGIQTVRLKGPGVFFGFSERYSLDCYMQ
jgi:transposase